MGPIQSVVILLTVLFVTLLLFSVFRRLFVKNARNNLNAAPNTCRSCGAALNSYQVVCVKCGCRIDRETSVNPPIVDSIFLLIIFPIAGIFSLILSTQAADAAKRGDYAEAIAKAKKARKINNVFCWVVFGLLTIMAVVIVYIGNL